MGQDKASLPFGDETLLERVVRNVSPAVDELVVAARAGQSVPGRAPVVTDPPGHESPMAGLVAGLRATSADVVFVTACDAPLLRPEVVVRLFELARGHEIAVPRVDEHHMVLTAVYARSVLPRAEALLEAGRLRPFYLLEQSRTRVVDPDELRVVDPELDALRDCDTPEAYAWALARAGLDAGTAAAPE
jgi:molybdopterin-guanine dinucleotide biosynthesis protein A